MRNFACWWALAFLLCATTHAAETAPEEPAANLQLPCVLSPWSGFTPCTKACTQSMEVVNALTKATMTVPSACACYRYRSRAVLQQPTGRAAPCGDQSAKQWCAPTSEGGKACLASYPADTHWAPPSCGAPPDVHYATKTMTGTESGDFVEYSCGEGFRVEGAPRPRCHCGEDGDCGWEQPPVCVHTLLVGANAGLLNDHADHRDTCSCDPFDAGTDAATDVRCEMSTSICDHASSNPQASVAQVMRACHTSRRTLRVLHRLNAGHKHHKCSFRHHKCKCCDCERRSTAPNGCPCGTAELLFRQKWRMGKTDFWWTFRPVAGTKTCQVRGEMKRLGWDRQTAPLVSDAYVLGRVGIRKHRLFFEGDWTQPADPRCQDIGKDVDSSLVWNLLAAVPYNGADCGSMNFFVSKAAGIEGYWHLKEGGPRQSTIGAGGFDTVMQAWSPRFISKACRSAANPCSPAHINSLAGADTDTTTEAVCKKKSAA